MNKVTTSNGFTLIELLVVLTIVSILAAIALPQYSAYRARAFDARARSDLQHAALAEEAYFLDAERYLSCQDSECIVLPGFTRLSSGVCLSLTGTTSGFTGQASDHSGSGLVFAWNSNLGGLVN